MTENKDPQDKNQPPVIRLKSPSGIIYYPRFVKDESGNWTLPDKEHWNRLLDLQDLKQQSEPNLPDEAKQNKEELSMIKENKMESTISTKQTETNDISTPKTQLPNSDKRVYIRRGKGMDMDTFNKVCVDLFRQAGMFPDYPPDSESKAGDPSNQDGDLMNHPLSEKNGKKS